MEVASLVVAIVTFILGYVIAYLKAEAKEKEEFKHALGNTENCQLFDEFVSKADGSITLFKSTLDAYNYCNEHLEPAGQYFTNKEKELSKHPEWFEKTTKAFVIRDRFYKKPYKKIILDALVKYDNDCDDLCNRIVENAKKNPGKVFVSI